MKTCFWYVSDFKHPWEGMVVGNLAAALRAAGVPVEVYVEGGTANVRIGEALSWNSLTLFERLAAVLFKGRFWHLWGKAPFWWNIVRLRARTVHTSLDESPDWKGHPTRLFAEQAREGESLINPTFEVKVAWTADSKDEDAPSSLLSAVPLTDALQKALERLGMEAVPLTAAGTRLKKGKALLVGDSPSDVLAAAYLTMQGLPVVSLKKAASMNSLLGKNGYIAVTSDEEQAWLSALDSAFSEEGRTISASARRFLKENFVAADSAESLCDLYRSVAAEA